MIPFVEGELEKLDTIFVSMDEVNKEGHPDWATSLWRAGFKRVEADWTLILQQDSLIHNPSLLPAILTNQYQVVSRLENPFIRLPCGCAAEESRWVNISRFEPDFILIETSLLKKTSLDFSPGIVKEIPLDHGGPWSQEVRKYSSSWSTLHRLGYHSPND